MKYIRNTLARRTAISGISVCMIGFSSSLNSVRKRPVTLSAVMTTLRIQNTLPSVSFFAQTPSWYSRTQGTSASFRFTPNLEKRSHAPRIYNPLSTIAQIEAKSKYKTHKNRKNKDKPLLTAYRDAFPLSSYNNVTLQNPFADDPIGSLRGADQITSVYS